MISYGLNTKKDHNKTVYPDKIYMIHSLDPEPGFVVKMEVWNYDTCFVMNVYKITEGSSYFIIYLMNLDSVLFYLRRFKILEKVSSCTY